MERAWRRTLPGGEPKATPGWSGTAGEAARAAAARRRPSNALTPDSGSSCAVAEPHIQLHRHGPDLLSLISTLADRSAAAYEWRGGCHRLWWVDPWHRCRRPPLLPFLPPPAWLLLTLRQWAVGREACGGSSRSPRRAGRCTVLSWRRPAPTSPGAQEGARQAKKLILRRRTAAAPPTPPCAFWSAGAGRGCLGGFNALPIPKGARLQV